MAYVELYRESGWKRWRWRRLAANHRRIGGPQQGFTTKYSAKRNAKLNHPTDRILDESGRVVHDPGAV